MALLEEAEEEAEFGLGMVDNAISVPDQVALICNWIVICDWFPMITSPYMTPRIL